MAMDTFYGYPLEGAILDNFTPKVDEEIVAGMFVAREADADGELIKATGSNAQVFFVVDSQTDNDVIESNSMSVVVKNATMLTDQYNTTENYVDGSKWGVSVEVDPGNHGKIRQITNGTAIAKAMGIVTRDEVDYLKLSF